MRVRDSCAESADVRSFEFETEDGTSLPDAIPGQHVVVKLRRPCPSVPPIIRFYSLCGAPGTGTYRIAVKREPHGAASRYLHETVKAGSLIEVGAPRGKFVLETGSAPICLISGGVGITPVLAMLHRLAADAEQQAISRIAQPDIWWIHATQNLAHHSFAEEVIKVASQLPSLHLVRVYSRPDPTDLKGRDYDLTGHLNLPMLQQVQIPREAECYLCGPTAFLSDITADLERLGVPSSKIHSEAFGASAGSATASKGRPPHPPLNNTGSGPMVSFARSGVSFRWGSAFNNLLEAAETCDVPVSWSCRSGVCHSCESGLISGDVQYSPEPIDRPVEGNLLICCSIPLSDVELDL